MQTTWDVLSVNKAVRAYADLFVRQQLFADEHSCHSDWWIDVKVRWIQGDFCIFYQV